MASFEIILKRNWNDAIFNDVGGCDLWKNLWNEIKNQPIQNAHVIPHPHPFLAEQEKLESIHGLSYFQDRNQEIIEKFKKEFGFDKDF